MMTSKVENIFKDKAFRYLIIMVSMILLLSSPLLFIDKELPTLWLNQYHSAFLDHLFYYFTYLGDGLVLIPVVIFLLFKRYTLAGLFAFFTIFEAILVQLIFKKWLFAHVDRPASYIPNFQDLHQVAGENIHHFHSFPSGHTQTIFMIIVFIALACRKNIYLNSLLIVIAIVTALSRVYLLQHFFIDIWFGAFIGFSIPIIGIYYLQKTEKFPLSKKKFTFQIFTKPLGD